MMRFRVEKSDRQFIKPRQVQRASRLAINQITSEIHKDLGGEIPKTHGTSIIGYRRVRSKKTLSKVRKKRMRGIVWQGTMPIQAIYAKGVAVQSEQGVRKGRHFFPGAFLATMKSDHVGIFKRIKGSKKIEEERIELTQAKSIANRKANEKLAKLPEAFRQHYMKMVKK